MSTKNLARTVIEGGRHRTNRWLRRYSHREERAAEHQLSHALLRGDPDGALYAQRRTVTRSFDDKLAPAKRWLRSQVGRPWDKVRGELMERFDTRTTAGRHVVFCHLLPSVKEDDLPERYSRSEFQVDRHGILRHVPRERFRWHTLWPRLPEAEAVLVAWLAGRRVGERDSHLYWFAPTPAGAFRQASLLCEADTARWRSLPLWFRERWDAFTAPPVDPRLHRSS